MKNKKNDNQVTYMSRSLFMALFLLFCTLGLVSSVSGYSVDVLETNPAPLKAGEYADITFRVSHSFQSERDTKVIFGLSDTTFMRVISQANYSIQNFPRGTSMTRTFRVHIADGTPTGFVDIPFYIYEGRGVIETKHRVFVEQSLTPPSLRVGKVRTTPVELLPDTKNNNIRVTVINLGDYDAKHVTARLVVSDEYGKASYSYSLEDMTSSISSNGEHEFSFTLDIHDDVLESFSAQLDLSYVYRSVHTNRLISRSSQLPFNIEMVSAPLLRIVDAEQLDSFAVGSSDNKVRLTIRNDGLGRAENVRLRLAPDVSYPFVFQQLTQYVTPSIRPGEEVTLQFTVEVLRNAEVRDFPVKAVLESLTGESRYSREDVFTITTDEGRGLGVRQIGMLLVGFVIVFGIIFGVLSFRKRNEE
ncbi:MAG: COG1361 S-layer family protein [Candidatus Woesearchaeota archaeon]